MELSPTMQRWCASGGNEIEYITLDMLNPAFNYEGSSGRIMLVHANESKIFTLETGDVATFHPAGFTFKLTDSGFNITIPGGGIDAIDQLEQWADSDDTPDIAVVLRTFLEGHDGPQRIYRGDLGTPKITAKGDLVFSAKYLSPRSIAFPSILYNKLTHPGL